ncbi:O-methylsterigmatocystin oxidoreductase [Mycena venus]|uniref:O-methylsterigmatocystin oxidoreductase n=1 Tax=Mycena venus TaxID=2733690 RepID=A0A8H6Y7Z1_9AGAR|nr:O-methylsterigmatocystin oxidoreductase [Mycena venus]
MTTSTILLVFCAVFACVFLKSTLGRKRYPPGPPSQPILGVARIHPKTEFWKTYAEWGRKYGHRGVNGSLISFHILGRRMVVLNSAADAANLLTKRSAIYSDRPFPPMAGTLMRREKSIFYISYNERFKMYRKLMHCSFNASAAQMYWEIQDREARILVVNIVKFPEKLVEHLRRNAAAVIMRIAYGYPVTQNDDHFIVTAEEHMRIGSVVGAPGKWLVDSLPFLRFLPEWFPGAGFKRKARRWSEEIYSQFVEPHTWVKQQMAAGTAVPSFTSALLKPSDGTPADAETEDLVLWAAGGLYAAGADTTVSATTTFFFAMMMYPAVQKRAQAEVDVFFARENRLPTLHDQEAFPYLACVIKEVLRWVPAAPIGVFHCTSQPDTYKDFLIPAKTTVIANIWAMMHDEEVYPDPFVFSPEKFMGSNPQPDPRECAFGFGRRICAGQNVAETTLWIQLALSLLTVNISKAVDENGKTIEPEIAFTTAIVSHVKPFPYQITPRAEAALALCRDFGVYMNDVTKKFHRDPEDAPDLSEADFMARKNVIEQVDRWSEGQPEGIDKEWPPILYLYEVVKASAKREAGKRDWGHLVFTDLTTMRFLLVMIFPEECNCGNFSHHDYDSLTKYQADRFMSLATYLYHTENKPAWVRGTYVTKSNGFTLDPQFLQTLEPPTNKGGKIFHVTADTFVPSLLSNELESIDTLLKQSGKSVPKAVRYQVLGSKETRPDVSGVWKAKNPRQCAQCEKISTKDLMLCSRCRLIHYCGREWFVSPISFFFFNFDDAQDHARLSQRLAWPTHKLVCKKADEE